MSSPAFSVGALRVGDAQLLGVPLSKRGLTFLILDLLGDQSGWTAQVVLKGHAILPDVRSLNRIVSCRSHQVKAAGLEGRKLVLLHLFARDRNGNRATLQIK